MGKFINADNDQNDEQHMKKVGHDANNSIAYHKIAGILFMKALSFEQKTLIQSLCNYFMLITRKILDYLLSGEKAIKFF